jgi:hypothetical protein
MTAMDNLTTATSSDREKVATSTKASATINDQLAAKGMWAQSKEAKLKRLLGGRVPTAPIVNIAPGGTYVIKSYRTKNDNYCWSHVYQV